jgi:hypothetical protein
MIDIKNLEWFSYKELITTDTGLKNDPDSWIIILNLLTLTINCLDPIRRLYKKPIKINSAYRSEAVNNVVNGAKKSQHMYGQAADITVGNPVKNKILFDLIVDSDVDFDQLIDEKDYQWLHISYSNIKNRHQILHLK